MSSPAPPSRRSHFVTMAVVIGAAGCFGCVLAVAVGVLGGRAGEGVDIQDEPAARQPGREYDAATLARWSREEPGRVRALRGETVKVRGRLIDLPDVDETANNMVRICFRMGAGDDNVHASITTSRLNSRVIQDAFAVRRGDTVVTTGLVLIDDKGVMLLADGIER